MIEFNPDDAEAYYNRGIAFFIKDEIDKVIVDYTEVITLTPEHSDAYFYRGIARLHKEEWEKSRLDLTVANDMGVDLIVKFHHIYDSIEHFEQKNGVHLPEDVALLLKQH